MTDLLDAVDELTSPIYHHIAQTDDEGKWLKVHTTELPSLMEQLENAVTSTMGGQGNGSTLKFARQIIDSDALHMFLTIKSQIIDWCHLAGVTPAKDPGVNLQQWAAVVKVDDGRFYIRTMGAWATQIRAKLDPPRQRQILHPCVVCAATVWVDEEGETKPHPVVAIYRPGENEVKAMCRACKAVWDGPDAVKELGEEISEIG